MRNVSGARENSSPALAGNSVVASGTTEAIIKGLETCHGAKLGNSHSGVQQ